MCHELGQVRKQRRLARLRSRIPIKRADLVRSRNTPITETEIDMVAKQ
jgi:hypothetical protein